MSICLPKSERYKLPKAICMRSPLRQAVWDKTDGLCFYCGRRLIADMAILPDATGFICQPRNTDMTIDHGTPKRRGGKDRIDNFFPSCERCNSKKGAKTQEEFFCG